MALVAEAALDRSAQHVLAHFSEVGWLQLCRTVRRSRGVVAGLARRPTSPFS